MSQATSDSWFAFRRRPEAATFGPVYESTKALVWTLCVRILKDPTEASDAFQSAYCRLLEAARQASLGPEADDGVSFVCRLAIREADRLRKRRARRAARELPYAEEATPMQDRQISVEDEAAQRELRERVEAVVEALPEPYRLPVQLHYLHGLSVREVARSLGQSPSTVSDRIQRALQKLEPACRRAGLGGAASTLAGIALGASLLQPSLSAAAVLARAEAALAAAEAAGAAASSSVPLAVLIGGAIAMKSKIAVVAGAALLALSAWLIVQSSRRTTATPSPAEDLALKRQEKTAPAPGPLAGEVAAPAAGPHRLEVAVVWSDTGGPIVDAEVRLLARNDGSPAFASARTDAAGRAALEAPSAWTSARVEALHPEGVAAGLSVPLPAAAPLRIAIDPDAIAGVVRDTLSGEPLPGSVVRAGARSATAGEDGSYLLAGLGDGLHEIRAGAEGHADRAAQVRHRRPGRSVQDFALDPSAALSISVVDEDGAPIAGASVTPSRHGKSGTFYGDDGQKTNAAGEVLFEKVSRLQTPAFSVSKEGFRDKTLEPSLDGRKEVQAIEVVLERPRLQMRAIAGRVRDPQGRPIAGAVLEWKDGESTSFGPDVVYGEHRAVTDRQGVYRLDFPDDYDKCHLGIAAKGFAPQVAQGLRPGTLAAPLEADFTLEPGHWLRGRVVDEDGKALAKVRIRAMPRRDLLHQAVCYPAVFREARTDADGRFEIEDLAGPKTALLISGGDRPHLEEEVEVDRDIDIVFRGYGAIRGQVIDAESGEPVPVFNVRLLGSGVSVDEWRLGESFSAGDGRFALRKLHRNSVFTLIIRADGYLPAELKDLTPQSESSGPEHRAALKRGRPIEGIVVDASTGAPVAGVEIGCTAEERAEEMLAMDWDLYRHLTDLQRTLTAENGAFRLLDDGAAKILVRAKGYQRLLIAPAGRGAYRMPDGGLRVPLEPAESVRGVYYRDGKPAPDAEVLLFRIGDAGADKAMLHGSARSAADGSFAWSDLAPGTYFLEVERKLDEPRPDFAIKIRRRLEVPGGEPGAVEFCKTLGDRTLRGRLAGLDATESLGATLVLRPLADGGGEEFSIQTYREWGWRFACPFLRPGKYAAEVSYYDQGAPRSARLRPLDASGDEEQELEVLVQGR